MSHQLNMRAMSKKTLEIGASIGLVVLMIALMVMVQATMPVGLHSTGFVIIVLAFMVLMGVVGIKLASA